MKLLISLAVLFVSAATVAHSTTYVVNPDGSGDFPTIQAAVDACVNGDAIELGDGTFRGAGNRGILYSGKAISIRSNSGNPETCIIDCEQMDRGFRISGGGPQTRLEDLTVTNGYASTGGAVYCEDSSCPTISNCVFSDNACETSGGAIKCSGSSPTIIRCVFYRNACGSGNQGGGMSCAWASPAPRLVDCMFRENRAGMGGGFDCYDSGTHPTLIGCEFVGNTASTDGGALLCSGDATVTVEQCRFVGNSAGLRCGALDCENGAITDCVFAYNWAAETAGAARCYEGTSAVSRCTFYGNSAPYGGGIAFRSSAATIRNCTFQGNSAAVMGGGIYCYVGAAPTIENTIVAASIEGEGVACEAGSSATLFCCDVYGNAGGDWVGYIAPQYGVNGNISADPLFCSPPDEDFGLHQGSPCAPFSPENPECDLVGAWPVSCGAAVDETEFVGGLQLEVAVNPSGSPVRLTYVIPERSSNVTPTFSFYDIAGRLVRTLTANSESAGEHTLEWDATSETGACISSGIYYCVLKAGEEQMTRRVVVVR